MRTHILSAAEVRVAARRPSKPAKGDMVVTSAEDLVAARLGLAAPLRRRSRARFGRLTA
jgi:hypothetical protein